METEILKPLSSAGEVDMPWIEKMLSQTFEFKIKVLELKSQLPKGKEGFLSEMSFLDVLYSGNDGQQKNIKLVLKVLPRDPKLRQFMAEGGLARREVEFYKFVGSKELQDICCISCIDLPVPETYFAGYAQDAITLVLRDMSVDGYKSVIVKDGSNLDQAKVALQAVAQIHAAGLMYLRKHGNSEENLKTISSEFNYGVTDIFLIPNMKTLIDMTESTPFSQTIKALEPVCKLMLSVRKKYPFIKTVIHGDLWAGQLLYSEDESKANVIDWQFCRVDNPATDVLSMLFMSCDLKVLDCQLDELLSCYWQAFSYPLQTAGVPLDVTFEQFKTNVENLLIYGFAFLVISLHDFIDGDSISKERVLGAVKFLDERAVFTKFFQLVESGGLS